VLEWTILRPGVDVSGGYTGWTRIAERFANLAQKKNKQNTAGLKIHFATMQHVIIIFLLLDIIDNNQL
jgi:hypothetical protein